MSTKAPHKRASWHDAFDAQMALWRWYRGPYGKLYMEDSASVNVQGLQGQTRALLLQMYGAEKQRLLDCDPIYVSAEMCEVIAAAAPAFEPEPLLETDLLTTRGFLYFAVPFAVSDRFENPTTIAGASWTRIYAADSAEQLAVHQAEMAKQEWWGRMAELEDKMLDEGGIAPGGIALTLYADTTAEMGHSNSHGEEVRELYKIVPDLVPLHLTPWYFNMTFGGYEWDSIGRPTGAGWWWRIVQSSLRLMQQRIAHKTLKRPERGARREATKLGARPGTEVVVVRLRREAGEKSEPTGESANYSHRFIVSGFWRNQWYPSASIHRQIWINPYIKGDPSLPLIIRPKRVYQWDR